MKKITFIGDIMCEEPLLRASRKRGIYDFSKLFSSCKRLFQESDCVIGNLETVFAGKKSGYTRDIFSFNTPDDFARAMAAGGINVVTTATNHALDRDKSGLIRTLDILDSVGIEHIGTYRSREDRKQIFKKKFEDRSISILNYTYGTNLNESPFLLKDNENYQLNLLMPQKYVKTVTSTNLLHCISKTLRKSIPTKYYLRIKKLFGREYINSYTDKLDIKEIDYKYIENIKNDVKIARESSDTIIVCLHIGGQFNSEPGDQTRYFVDFLSSLGVDYIINTHAHVVQKSEVLRNSFVAYCLGNFSISPSSVYVPHNLLPEYSIALHIYIDEGKKNKLTFSILKIIENRRHELSVYPVDELISKLDKESNKKLEKEVTFIYNRFTQNELDRIPVLREYELVI